MAFRVEYNAHIVDTFAIKGYFESNKYNPQVI